MGGVMEVKDGRLIINVPITEGTLSKSGKSVVSFTTSGNQEINNGFFLGVNLYKKRV